MDKLLSDILYAWRALRKNAALAAVVVISLGIGIGANSAIFSVVDALMLRPLPYPQPDRLVAIWLGGGATQHLCRARSESRQHPPFKRHRD